MATTVAKLVGISMSKSSLILGDASSVAINVLSQQGLIVDTEAELDRPNLPADITALDEEDLMILYTKFAAYSDFVTTQLACAIADEKEMQRQLDVLEATKSIQFGGSVSAKVTLVRAQVAADPEVLDMQADLSKIYAYRKLLETMANNCERGSQVCSRELTRRTAGDSYKTRSRRFTA